MKAQKQLKIDAEDIFLCAESFFAASLLVLDRFPKTTPGTRDSLRYDILAPYVANSAFSLELYFKCIYFLDKNRRIKGHSLLKLFSKKLSKPRQDKIDEYASAFSKNDQNFSALCNVEPMVRTTTGCLKYSDRAFEYYRYVFEGPMLTDKATGTYETFQLAIFHIIMAVRRLIVEIQPTWNRYLSTPIPEN